MRLFVAIVWSLATVMWLPWFAVFVRLLVDLCLGVALTSSEYLNPALVGIWPTLGWTSWSVVSWLPILALLAMSLVYIGWRFFWWVDDWVKTYGAVPVVLSILIPPLALILLYRDARRRFRARNVSLHTAVDDARERIDEQESLSLLS